MVQRSDAQDRPTLSSPKEPIGTLAKAKHPSRLPANLHSDTHFCRGVPQEVRPSPCTLLSGDPCWTELSETGDTRHPPLAPLPACLILCDCSLLLTLQLTLNALSGPVSWQQLSHPARPQVPISAWSLSFPRAPDVKKFRGRQPVQPLPPRPPLSPSQASSAASIRPDVLPFSLFL